MATSPLSPYQNTLPRNPSDTTDELWYGLNALIQADKARLDRASYYLLFTDANIAGKSVKLIIGSETIVYPSSGNFNGITLFGSSPQIARFIQETNAILVWNDSNSNVLAGDPTSQAGKFFIYLCNVPVAEYKLEVDGNLYSFTRIRTKTWYTDPS